MILTLIPLTILFYISVAYEFHRLKARRIYSFYFKKKKNKELLRNFLKIMLFRG
ncbi:Uncharacterised protein [Serratia entomophila]|jgi:hypothetical protein|nr:Uncharacterised protein [Serratia entomophila]CAI0779086.1 Uncharacterised protein [Serratia entomophila]CAI0800855.1 Uncharacterised protein [Serratia entomophila]CAI0801125.1 Uncharacterised protein [Serratia entomophila]CAI0801288.1 Uncharacterised protein [Serratia entomophila]